MSLYFETVCYITLGTTLALTMAIPLNSWIPPSHAPASEKHPPHNIGIHINTKCFYYLHEELLGNKLILALGYVCHH